MPETGTIEGSASPVNSLVAEHFVDFPAYYSVMIEDNFDSTHDLLLYFRIPLEAVQILKVTCNIFNYKFRGYAISNTYESFHTHIIIHAHSINHSHTTSLVSHSHEDSTAEGHLHGIFAPAPTATNSVDFYTGSPPYTEYTVSSFTTTSTASPTVSETVGSVLSGPGEIHNHDVIYGISPDSYAHNEQLFIDGTGFGQIWNPNINPDHVNIRALDITPLVSNNSSNEGVHLLKIKSSQNGRATVQIYVRCILKYGKF